MNKIGKNPHLVSNRETLDSDCKTMNAIVNALSGGSSLDSPPPSPSPVDHLKDLGKILENSNLPRAASQGNVFVTDLSSPSAPCRADTTQPSFHKSDIYLGKFKYLSLSEFFFINFILKILKQNFDI